jgi:enoyl-CoA hydratase/carnithine racemase
MSVTYEVEREIAVIELARPEKFNSVSPDLSRDFIEALRRAEKEARAVVITGQGNAFCAGADLADLMSEYQTGGPRESHRSPVAGRRDVGHLAGGWRPEARDRIRTGISR